MVIGSDGVRSKARELVLGYVDNPKVSHFLPSPKKENEEEE